MHDGQLISLGSRIPACSYLRRQCGGIDVEPVLGSRSYDVMSAIGLTPAAPGDVLLVGTHTDEYPELDQAPVATIEARCSTCVLRAPGRLVRRPGRTGAQRVGGLRPSDRVGMRLTGTPPRYREPAPAAAVEGATAAPIQVPPNGLPVILDPTIRSPAVTLSPAW